MNKFLKANKIKLRQESSNYTDYEQDDNGNYIVHMEVREESSILFSIDINVPDQDFAERMCAKWAANNQEIYAYIMKQLLN